MSILKRRALPLAIGLALGAVGTAQAAPGWYVGVGFGTTGIDDFDAGSAGDLEGALGAEGITATVDSFSTDDSDTGWHLYGGYAINEYFAIEGFYVDLGSFDASLTGTVDDGGEGGPLPLSVSASVEGQGFGVFGVLSYPVVGGLSVLGKAGGIHWDADVPVALVIDSFGVSDSVGDDGTSFAWGAGARWAFTDHLAVDVLYESYEVLDSDIDLLSGNVTWMF